MVELFSKQGQSALDDFISKDTLFAFDLDGTLAPIVPNPAEIRIEGIIQDYLKQLTEQAVTAIITGRSSDDAIKFLDFKPHYLIGNHGAEGLPGYEQKTESLKKNIASWEEQLQLILPPQLKAAIVLEHKGFSLSLHYRHLQDTDFDLGILQQKVNKLVPSPRCIGGKFVLNIIPEDAPDKGDALLSLLEVSGCSNAFFIGDDETDEDIFRLEDRRIFAVSIGKGRTTAATYLMEHQHQIGKLLQRLLELTS